MFNNKSKLLFILDNFMINIIIPNNHYPLLEIYSYDKLACLITFSQSKSIYQNIKKTKS